MVFFESKKTAGNKETGEAFFFRDSGAAIKGGRVSRLMFLAAVMHATVTKKRLRPMAIKARGGTEHQGGKGGGGKNRGGTRVDRGEKKTKQRKKKREQGKKTTSKPPLWTNESSTTTTKPVQRVENVVDRRERNTEGRKDRGDWKKEEETETIERWETQQKRKKENRREEKNSLSLWSPSPPFETAPLPHKPPPVHDSNTVAWNHRSTSHQHHRQLIYPSSSSQVILPLISVYCSSSCMKNVHCARSASKKIINRLLCMCTVTG